MDFRPQDRDRRAAMRGAFLNRFHVIYENKGYWFRTPEAWDITGNFRADMYMRPIAIGALEMTPKRAE